MMSGSGSATNYYACVENSTQLFLQKDLANTITNIATGSTTGAPGDVLEIDRIGSTLNCYKNGALVLTGSDSTLTGGSPGFWINGNVATAMNAQVGNINPPAALNQEQYLTAPQHFVQPISLAGEQISAAPRSEQNVFLPGALTSTWTGATWTTDRAVTVTRVQVQAKTAPSGCSTNAVVRLTDGTTPVNVTISAAANDSGAIAQSYAAGASLTVGVQTAAAGCTTSPADANVVVQYKMQ